MVINIYSPTFPCVNNSVPLYIAPRLHHIRHHVASFHFDLASGSTWLNTPCIGQWHKQGEYEESGTWGELRATLVLDEIEIQVVATCPKDTYIDIFLVPSSDIAVLHIYFNSNNGSCLGPVFYVDVDVGSWELIRILKEPPNKAFMPYQKKVIKYFTSSHLGYVSTRRQLLMPLNPQPKSWSYPRSYVEAGHSIIWCIGKTIKRCHN